VFKNGLESASSLVLALGIFAYSMQIYFDFAGYSKMAIGIGKMFGFEFPVNFNRPYLSRSVTEFWRRWHITLSDFLKEYVYFPIGGSRVSKVKIARNLLVTFLLTGIWHGANWTFFVWGLYFGVFIIIEKLLLGKFVAKIPAFLRQIITFLIVYIGWILFQAESIEIAQETLMSILQFEGGVAVPLLNFDFKMKLVLFVAAGLSFIPIYEKKLHSLEKSTYFRSLMIILLLTASAISIAGSSFHPFLYFKF
jgi:alginate O-acetyltransferase complex protein AlgI